MGISAEAPLLGPGAAAAPAPAPAGAAAGTSVAAKAALIEAAAIRTAQVTFLMFMMNLFVLFF